MAKVKGTKKRTRAKHKNQEVKEGEESKNLKLNRPRANDLVVK